MERLLEKTKVHREDNRIWRLPEVVHFEKVKWESARLNMSHYGMHCYYDVLGFRAPKKGEHYLSGNPMQAYIAPNDLRTDFLVVVPTFTAARRTIYVQDCEVVRDARGQFKRIPKGEVE